MHPIKRAHAERKVQESINSPYKVSIVSVSAHHVAGIAVKTGAPEVDRSAEEAQTHLPLLTPGLLPGLDWFPRRTALHKRQHNVYRHLLARDCVRRTGA